MCSPSFDFVKIHPFVALCKDVKNISPPAGGEEGYAPSTAPPFEKGGRKLSPMDNILCLTSIVRRQKQMLLPPLF